MNAPLLDLTEPRDPREVLKSVETLVAAKDFDQAHALTISALEQAPDNGDLLNCRGYVFNAMGQHAEALHYFREALRRHPASSGIWSNCGNAYKALKYYAAAIACIQNAIRLSAGEPYLHHNLALCLAEAGQHGEAIAAFSKTLELDPDYHLARWGRARSYFFLGNYRMAWPDYEVRKITGQLPARSLPGAPWAGEVYTGKRLIILQEQGFGDTLWALRYLARVKALGGELIVECQPALYAQVEALKIANVVVPSGYPLPEADFHSYFCSLPGLYSKQSEQISGQPYLAPIPWRARGFKKRFEAKKDVLKVGIVWSGSVTFGKNADRALTLRRLLQAVDLPGVQLYSLQKGPPEQELQNLDLPTSIIDLSPHLNDFADTAAAVSELDLVIMTDSAVAHLAGALGKPVWVLLGYSAHWLWLLDRADTPWYNSVKLFRPRVEDDWTYVLDKVSVELMKLTQRANIG